LAEPNSPATPTTSAMAVASRMGETLLKVDPSLQGLGRMMTRNDVRLEELRRWSSGFPPPFLSVGPLPPAAGSRSDPGWATDDATSPEPSRIAYPGNAPVFASSPRRLGQSSPAATPLVANTNSDPCRVTTATSVVPFPSKSPAATL